MKMLFKNCLLGLDEYRETHDISVCDGVIATIGKELPPTGFDLVFEFDNCFVFPGFADLHVHFREPGFSYKETIYSGSRAAARGGFTAVCTMPNLDPVPDCPKNIKLQQDIIDRDSVIAVYPIGSITVGQKGRGTLCDYKALLPYTHIFSDDGRGVQSDELMEEAMLAVKHAGGIITAHCEDESLLKKGGCAHDGDFAEKYGLVGINSRSEWGQVERDLKLVERTGCRYHVCHISTRQSVELIREAKRRGLPVSCETAPHYLWFSDDMLKNDGRFKMNPPIRTEDDKNALIEGIKDGTIDVIATDHAPHALSEKSGGFENSLFGVVGLETSFAACYTALVKTGIISIGRLIELMSINPRRIFGLEPAEVIKGASANFTVADINKSCVVDPSEFRSMGRSTPFEGQRLYGSIETTVYKGVKVW